MNKPCSSVDYVIVYSFFHIQLDILLSVGTVVVVNPYNLYMLLIIAKYRTRCRLLLGVKG